MRLQDIEKALAGARSNGIYFRDTEWGYGNGTVSALAYLSKKGKLYITYVDPIKDKRMVSAVNTEIFASLRTKNTLEIWEGSL